MMRARQGGMTLIEILVSLLILAIGMLGMAGLQTVSLRNTQSAYQRTQAAILSNDIVERVRANLQGVEDGSYDNAATHREVNKLIKSFTYFYIMLG